MAKRTYEFDILAKIDQAISAIDKLATGSQKKLDSISFNTAVSAIVDGFGVVERVATATFSAIKNVTDDAIDSAIEAEQAELALANALRIAGDFSAQAVRDFDKLAESIEKTTIFSDEAVKSSAAIAKQYRLTNIETEKTIKVAADLAARTGTDLNTAVQRVALTFEGFRDKGLVKMIPGLKALSEESLRAGGAIELIQRAVNGSAAALSESFAGAIARSRNFLDNMLESLGKLITQNPAVIAGINKIGEGFQFFNQQIIANSEPLQKLVTQGFLAIIQAAPALVAAVKAITDIFLIMKLAVDAAFATLKQFADFGSFFELIANPVASLKKIPEIIKEFDKLRIKFGENREASKKFFDDFEANTQKIVDSVTKAVNSAGKMKTALSQGPSTTGVEFRVDESAEALEKKIAEASKQPIEKAIEFAFSATAKLDNKTGIAIGAGLVSNIVKGAEGAKKAVSAALGAAANTLLPGIGGVVSDIVTELQKGPEAVKQQVQAFAREIPNTIVTIIEALPALIEALIDEIPRLIDAIIAKIPTIIEAIISKLPELQAAFIKLMPSIAIALSKSLIENIPNIVGTFATEFLKIPERFADELFKSLKGGGVLDGISGKDSGGIFEGIPLLGGLGDLLGLAEGGTIDRRAVLEHDGGIAKIGSNETVIDSELTDWLRGVKNNGGFGGGPQEIVINIGLQQFARVMLQARKAGYEV